MWDVKTVSSGLLVIYSIGVTVSDDFSRGTGVAGRVLSIRFMCTVYIILPCLDLPRISSRTHW